MCTIIGTSVISIEHVYFGTCLFVRQELLYISKDNCCALFIQLDLQHAFF